MSNTKHESVVILYHSKLERIEDVNQYEKGGYHPVLLSDTFENGRYRVIHKLGHGGSSTVWLARDNLEERYVALKILCAEASDDVCDLKILDYLQSRASSHPGRKHIGFLDNSFRIQGPNGSHLALVSGVLGPSFSELMGSEKQLRRRVAQRLAKQFTQAVAYLHSEGVCHGGKKFTLLTLPYTFDILVDLTAANIAFELENFDSLSEDELYSQIGKPITAEMQTVSG